MQHRVLLLNGSTWEPLSVITVQRAINLMLGGKAIAVEMTGWYLNTVRTKFEVPSVIALRSYVNVPRRKSHWSRKGVLVRDDYTCIYCGIKTGRAGEGQSSDQARLHHRPCHPPLQRWPGYLVKHGLRLCQMQPS